MDKVPQLVRKKSQPFIEVAGLGIGKDRVVLVAEFRYGVGDRIVQASIERSKLIDLDRGVELNARSVIP